VKNFGVIQTEYGLKIFNIGSGSKSQYFRTVMIKLFQNECSVNLYELSNKNCISLRGYLIFSN